MTKATSPRRPKLLVVLGEGGHTAQTLRLLQLLGPGFRYIYVISRSDEISARKITIPGPIHRLTRPRAKDDGLPTAAWHLGVSLLEAAWLVLRCRPDAVVGCGPAVQVPPAFFAKLLGAKIIFIESASRVSELSLTGKIMLRLADRFFVQWEPLQRRYPRTTFAGRLL
jgi:beta-1,4-N-acetylglucosaminyltransferase